MKAYLWDKKETLQNILLITLILLLGYIAFSGTFPLIRYEYIDTCINQVVPPLQIPTG